jgi:predicted acylesterase/phospholipase RssA
MEREKITTLSLPGGFMRGVPMLGVLSELEELGMLDNITTYFATSVGAVISLLLSIGYKPDEIFKFVLEHLIKDVQTSVTKSIQELGSRGCFMESNFIVEHIRQMISKKGIDPDLTMEEHHILTGKRLICTSHVVDMKTSISETKYLSYETSPTLMCVDALKMSFSIPFIFDIIEAEQTLYFDGGVRMNIPFRDTPDDESTMIVMVEETDVSQFGNRTVIYVPIKLHSLNVMLPINVLENIYTIAKFRTKMRLVKEKKD